jgi:hypothetical protein
VPEYEYVLVTGSPIYPKSEVPSLTAIYLFGRVPASFNYLIVA